MMKDSRTGGEQRYDVVVVGGGAAGLSAALTLGRARCSVLVVDAGQPRNAPASGVHNYLGREGTPPADLLAAGRGEVRGYGGEILEDTVVAAEHRDGGGFRVVLASGGAVLADRLLVATGLVDELPEVPGVAELWGTDVLHCPYCHGWEVRDQAIGVLGTGPLAVHQALLWRQWSDNVTLFLHTAPKPDEEEYEQLAARGIAVVDGQVAALETAGGRLAGVYLFDGTGVSCQALAVAPRFTARADFLAPLGLEATDQERGGHVIGSCIAADATGATTVPGVWVVGNAANLMEQVIGAAAAGVRAATAIHADLIAEETRRAVAAYRDPFSPQTERELCERVLGDRRHGLQDHHRSKTKEHTPMPDDVNGTPVADFWDAFYRASEQIWSGNPNAALVRELAELPPGRALDLGCGEGADAIWLAQQGWRVTATDISRVALDRAAEHAASVGVADRIDWQHHDLAVSFPVGTFDLVSAHFLHSPTDLPREKILRTAAAAVAPGGVFLIVGHAEQPAEEHDHDPGTHFPTPEEVHDALGLPAGQWELLLSDVHEHTRTGPEGKPAAHKNNTLKLRRLPA